jgi:hypothetical protein
MQFKIQGLKLYFLNLHLNHSKFDWYFYYSIEKDNKKIRKHKFENIKFVIDKIDD